MSKRPAATIIITNYNYAQFLPASIDSALAQTCPDVEVIVVDDGSTDDSRAIIACYDNRIKSVLKENGGQLSAIDAGISASRGEVVFFLDSDDILISSAVQSVVDLFSSRDLAKVHWPMWVIDKEGNTTGEIRYKNLPEGDFRDQVIRQGPHSVRSAPTSANAWSRQFLERVRPVPLEASYYRTCADEYFFNLAPLFGSVGRLMEPQGYRRVHGASLYGGKRFHEKLALEIEGHEETSRVMGRFCRQIGVEPDQQAWRRNSWFHRLKDALIEIQALVPIGEAFLLADDYKWALPDDLDGRYPIAFVRPDDLAGLIEQIEKFKSEGGSVLVFAWPAFWWLEHYSDLREQILLHYQQVTTNDRIIVFDVSVRQPQCRQGSA